MDETQWTRHKLLNIAQSLALITALGLILGVLGWIVGGPLPAWSAVTLVVVLYFLNPMLAPNLALRLYRGRPIHPAEAPRLYEIVQILAQRAGLPRLPILYYLPSDVMNAFATGPRERAAIAISNGLLQRLDVRELAGVLAHEISHLRHNDIRIMTFADLAARLTHLLALLGQVLLLLSLPLLLLGAYQVNWLLFLIMIFAPTLSALLQLALSRTREFDADLGAAELLGSPLPLAGALLKMERYQGRWLEQIIWPGRQVPEPSLLRTHPPTEERIRRLLELQEQTVPALFHDIDDAGEYPELVSRIPFRPKRRVISGVWY